jgi:AmpD protein
MNTKALTNRKFWISGMVLFVSALVLGGALLWWSPGEKTLIIENQVTDISTSEEADNSETEPQVLGQQNSDEAETDENSSSEVRSSPDIEESATSNPESAQNPQLKEDESSDEAEEGNSEGEDENEKSEEESEAIGKPSIKQDLVNFGHQKSSGRSIDTIIIHSSYDALGDEPYNYSGLVGIYHQYGVAAHYLIDREGQIYQLVRDRDIAYHAGQSQVPDGRTSVNKFSLGIELMNTKEDEYTKKQYYSLNQLLNYLEDQYSIKYILGHDDIAPDRKTDPWNFDWDKID